MWLPSKFEGSISGTPVFFVPHDPRQTRDALKKREVSLLFQNQIPIFVQLQFNTVAPLRKVLWLIIVLYVTVCK